MVRAGEQASGEGKKPTRVIVVGLGAMGSGIARLLLDKKGIEIAAAAASRKEKQGKDLGRSWASGIKRESSPLHPMKLFLRTPT